IRLFRTGQWLYRSRSSRRTLVLWKVWVLVDRVWFQTLLGADLPPAMECGRGLRLAHAGRNVVFHPRVRFGERCTIYHSVTAGLRGDDDLVPRFGDDVVLGTGCVV